MGKQEPVSLQGPMSVARQFRPPQHNDARSLPRGAHVKHFWSREPEKMRRCGTTSVRARPRCKIMGQSGHAVFLTVSQGVIRDHLKDLVPRKARQKKPRNGSCPRIPFASQHPIEIRIGDFHPLREVSFTQLSMRHILSNLLHIQDQLCHPFRPLS